MDTIDPEVRADVEFGGRLLARAAARRQAAAAQQDSADSASAVGTAVAAPDSWRQPDTSRSSSSSAAAAAGYGGQGAGGSELDAAGFVALMEDVLARTKGGFRRGGECCSNAVWSRDDSGIHPCHAAFLTLLLSTVPRPPTPLTHTHRAVPPVPAAPALGAHQV